MLNNDYFCNKKTHSKKKKRNNEQLQREIQHSKIACVDYSKEQENRKQNKAKKKVKRNIKFI